MHPEAAESIRNKTILLISPQSWGKMFISKHHYAVELAKCGNQVYFLNPPDQTLTKRISIKAIEQYPGLFIIEHRLWFPYIIKYHAIPLFHLLMYAQVKAILRKMARPMDIVWSFDLGHLYPFRFFSATTYKIFHPVDEPLTKDAIDAAKGANMIISVTREILEKYDSYQVPKYLVNHGVSDDFLKPQPGLKKDNDVICVGFSGNLMRPDIDRDTLLKIITVHPEVIFECWGSYQEKDGNIGGGMDKATIDFINNLRAAPNVILHGAVSTSDLAAGLHRMDAFIICYDIKKDQSKGTNYHKIMEYLATGKVIISNNVTAYADRTDLMVMPEERTNNNKLPELFTGTIRNIGEHNSNSKQYARKEFACNNRYTCQIAAIARFL